MCQAGLVKRHSVSYAEIFGLRPLRRGLKQCWAALSGDEYAPPSLFGLSSLSILKPRVAFPLWLGRTRRDRRAWVYQLPNRVPPPRSAGYSVRVTFARDFRGRQLTYDSHVGTDFAVPVGTEVIAPAAGLVCSVRNDMQRGGLKVCIEHGLGLVTCCNHLARSLVEEGQHVFRGDLVGLSGMSSIDGLLFSPWLAPHVHFNVLLNGIAVDPWATDAEVSLWRQRNRPTPHAAPPVDDYRSWDPPHQRTAEVLESCRDPDLRRSLAAINDDRQRAARVAIERLLYAHRFDDHEPLAAEPREPWLDLPLSAADYSGVAFVDTDA